MGGCFSSNNKNKKLPSSAVVESVSQRCLILGAGYSGKTTCFKHIAGDDGFPESERQSYAECLVHQYNLLLEGLLAHHTRRGNSQSSDPRSLPEQLETLWALYGREWPLPYGADLGEDLFIPEQHVELQNCVSESSKYMIERASARLGEFVQPVSKQDLLNVRVRTTGIVERKFSMVCSDGEIHHGSVFDVGGPRNERKKWMHCFENVTLLVFVVDLGSYCYALWEDATMCSLCEQLNLFTEISGSKWFPDTLFCIVFNHLDRFLRMASRKPFNSQIFPDAPKITVGKEWEGVEYIKQLFLSKSRHPLPFVVTTSLIHAEPVFLHQGLSEKNDFVVTLVNCLVDLPAVLCSLVAEYAAGSNLLITPEMADALRAQGKRLATKEVPVENKTSDQAPAKVDMGGLTCQRHTYAPADRV